MRLLPINNCCECAYHYFIWGVKLGCGHEDIDEEKDDMVSGEGIPDWCPLERKGDTVEKDKCRCCGEKLEGEKINNICKDCYWKGRDRK